MRCLVLGLVFALSAVGNSFAEDQFAPPVRIQSGDEPIDVANLVGAGSYFGGAAPFFGDFDGDGLSDLLVGQDIQPGRLRIYRNVGTRQKPKFDGFEWFQVHGQVAELPSHGLFRPQLVDLNGDQKLDIVAATAPGMVCWYQKLEKGEFADAAPLKLASGRVLDAGRNAACYAVDADGDGDMDLFVTGYPALNARTYELRFVENTGSSHSPSFAIPKLLEAEAQPIQLDTECQPIAVDWNGDGKIDVLLCLQNGCVLLCENLGENGTLQLTQPRQLVLPPAAPRQPQANEGLTRGRGTGFCVTDWDDDGRLDILIGDAQQEIVQPEVADANVRLEELQREAAQILSVYRRARRVENKLNSETQAQKKDIFQNAREKNGRRLEQLRDEIAKLEQSTQIRQVSHGYVWLLRRSNSP